MAPEELELNKKRRVLDRWKERLADREEEMTDLLAELDLFEGRYKLEVARFYAQLDEIEAQIAEEEHKLVPDDMEILRKVEELRRRAEESAAEAKCDTENIGTKWNPTQEAKKAYHNLARVIHPDLALDVVEKERRHNLMTQLNEAYAAGDQNRLNQLVEDFRDSPDLISGDSIGDQLVRAIRQIFQIKKRLLAIKDEMRKAKLSEAYSLRLKSESEALEGRDMLLQMGARAKSHIMKAERRLANLTNLNQTQEDYVKDEFGFDIKEFRQ